MRGLSVSALLFLLISPLAITEPTRRDAPANSTTIYPSTTSLSEDATGSIIYGVPYGLILKSQGGSDIGSLVTFDIPAWAAESHCEFAFSLNSHGLGGGTVTLGTGQTDITMSDDPTRDASANQRDQDMARIQAVVGGDAEEVVAFVEVVVLFVGDTFPCPAGQVLIAEMLPTRDLGHIEWDVRTEGPEIRVSKAT